MFKVTFATLGTAFVFAASTAAAQSARAYQANGLDPHRYEPGAHYYDRDVRQDRRDIRCDNRDIHQDRRDIVHDQRMLMRYRDEGDWNGMRMAEAHIQRDKRDIARDRNYRYWDRRD
jgi:hypothetical protein